MLGRAEHLGDDAHGNLVREAALDVENSVGILRLGNELIRDDVEIVQVEPPSSSRPTEYTVGSRS
jgi:hypothetical protein